MNYLRSFLSALGMFTAVPMPQLDWDMEHGSRMTACFGLTGAVLGALYLLLAWIFSFFFFNVVTLGFFLFFPSRD